MNPSAFNVLLMVLNGGTEVASLAQALPTMTVRSVQRAVERLYDLGLIDKNGPNNNPRYTPNFTAVINLKVPDKLLEDETRPQSQYHFDFLGWLEQLSGDELDTLLEGVTKLPESVPTARDMEQWMVELSWKSSSLEGNTYSLLDTQLLLTEGVRPDNRTAFETQMVLNHKAALAFILEHKDLFGSNLQYATIEKLHSLIAQNLDVATGIRQRLVRISASNYVPVAPPAQLRELVDRSLALINRSRKPFVKALLAFALLPYLQPFEDCNKRVGRLLANALLIHSVGRGFSLRSTDARSLALAYLAFYEVNSLDGLKQILLAELA